MTDPQRITCSSHEKKFVLGSSDDAILLRGLQQGHEQVPVDFQMAWIPVHPSKGVLDRWILLMRLQESPVEGIDINSWLLLHTWGRNRTSALGTIAGLESVDEDLILCFQLLDLLHQLSSFLLISSAINCSSDWMTGALCFDPLVDLLHW
ncbi:hypothetical protein M0R45_026136 [Rubus argutus]|uniref:Uncharacterized protein n=1 Tax=Rubus argutus TaxID=59490 RepID=A0AAW1WWP3_RUBAR